MNKFEKLRKHIRLEKLREYIERERAFAREDRLKRPRPLNDFDLGWYNALDGILGDVLEKIEELEKEEEE